VDPVRDPFSENVVGPGIEPLYPETLTTIRQRRSYFCVQKPKHAIIFSDKNLGIPLIVIIVRDIYIPVRMS
jgi:hypothetical protein